MAPVPKNTKIHFTHPNHPLIYLSDDQDYFCDGCKTFGSDSRFRCHACDFDLHEYCANCPEKLSSFIHHHDLALKLLKLEAGVVSDRFCDICLDPVEGLFYQCKDCDFDAHPLCTQLPKELRHVADDDHPLKLQKLRFGSCVVCRTDCSSLWVYGCDICGVNIHLDCLFEPYESPVTPPVKPPGLERSGTGTTSRGISFAQPPWPTGPPPVPYGVAVPYGVSGYPFGFYHGPPYNYVNHPTSSYGYVAPPPPPPPSSGGKLRKSMFSLIGQLTMNAMTTSIFGIPLSF